MCVWGGLWRRKLWLCLPLSLFLDLLVHQLLFRAAFYLPPLSWNLQPFLFLDSRLSPPQQYSISPFGPGPFPSSLSFLCPLPPLAPSAPTFFSSNMSAPAAKTVVSPLRSVCIFCFFSSPLPRLPWKCKLTLFSPSTRLVSPIWRVGRRSHLWLLPPS